MLFVTGSGTGVGKTLVSRLIITELARRGLDVRALKPIVTGYDDAQPQTSDPALLLDALGLACEPATLERVSPWRFRAPLAPDMAAACESRSISFDSLVAHCRAENRGAITIIEGIGGVMVPIDDRHTVIDWIEALGCDALLVTGSYLGAISHTLSALAVLQSHRIPVRGIVVSESPGQPVPLAETVRTIARFAGGQPIVALPRLTDESAAPELVTALGIAMDNQ